MAMHEYFYVQYWHAILTKCCGWTDEEVMTWCRQYEDDLRDKDSIFYHEPPAYYLVRVFLPHDLSRRWKLHGKEFFSAFSTIQKAIEGKPGLGPDEELDNLDATCERINRAINELCDRYTTDD